MFIDPQRFGSELPEPRQAMTRHVANILCLLALIAAYGCKTPPSAHVSDPAVFTVLHLHAADQAAMREMESLGVDPRNHSIRDHLNRYFALPVQGDGSYDQQQLRM